MISIAVENQVLRVLIGGLDHRLHRVLASFTERYPYPALAGRAALPGLRQDCLQLWLDSRVHFSRRVDAKRYCKAQGPHGLRRRKLHDCHRSVPQCC